MRAAKKIILLLGFVLTSLATASALTPGATETRVGQKSFAALESRQAEPLQTPGLHQRNATRGCELAPESLLAARTTPVVGDHIVLGLERHGLQQTATQVGGRTLLNDVNWQTTLQTAVGNPSTRFTISLDGVSGSSAYSQFMNAAQRGVAPGATPFNWEMGQLYQAGRHVDATLVRELGTTVPPNPFRP